jgi:adenylate cyclase
LLDVHVATPTPLRETEAAILLADLRGFTSMAEVTPLDEVVRLLNGWLDRMAGVIKAHGGVVDRFLGDAVLAVFGVPRGHSNDCRRAVACAVAIQNVMVGINADHRVRGLPPLYVGIAVTTGPVIAGTFGSTAYREDTVIGPAVNLAARIEGYSLRGQVLLDPDAYERVKDVIELRGVNSVWAKGKRDPIVIYDVSAVHWPQSASVPSVDPRHSPRVPMPDLPLTFHQVHEDRVLPEQHVGRILDLGYHGLRIGTAFPLTPFSEIALEFRARPASDAIASIYAKVLRSTPCADGFHTSLQFTDVGTPDYEDVKRCVDASLWRSRSAELPLGLSAPKTGAP